MSGRHTTVHDVVVVGAGPIGASTARHLADRGADVVVVGPDEPAGYDGHEGTWAGYYDEGRIAHVLEVPLVTSILAMRSIRRMGELAARTGLDCLTPTHSVTVLPADPPAGSAAEWFDRDVLAGNARDLGVDVEFLDEAQLRAAYPQLSFEPGHVALVQRDAHIINPRALVRAELAAATRAGATLVRDLVIGTEAVDDGVRVIGQSGTTWSARQVVLATGAASNVTGLLPRPLVLPMFGATVVLVEVPDPQALTMPTSMYLKQRGEQQLFGGIVMAPRPYPDGRWYLKLAGASLLQFPLDGAQDVAAWVRTGGNQADIDEAMAVVGDLLPGRRLGPARTRPCLVAATPTNRPYIDRVDERTVVAVEAERGAMAGDEIGRLAAALAVGPWQDTLPQEVFAAQWADPGWTSTGYLAQMAGYLG